MKKIPILALVSVFMFLFIRFFLGGPEDSWICQNGEWVRHGNPSSEKPSEACEKALVLYWGTTCIHCKNVEEFINSWEKKDSVKIERLEVMSNKTNAQKLIKQGEVCNLPKEQIGSVPLLVTPDGKCLSGDGSIIDYLKGLK